MKHKIFVSTFVLLLSSFFSSAQFFNPGFNYQAVIRDTNGEIIANQEIEIIFSINGYGGLCNPCTWYQEIQYATTNEFGILNLIIGNGFSASEVTLEDIPWYLQTELEVEIDLGNGWVNMGTYPISSVPTSMYSLGNWSKSGDSQTTEDHYLGTNDSQPLRIVTAETIRLFIASDGDVGIGTLEADPMTKLQIEGGNDAILAADASGYFIIGDVNGANIVMDNNEIISRNNGLTNELYLQAEGGAVVINSVTSTSHELYVNGTAAKPGGGSWTATSDARLKENVQPFTQGLDEVMEIEPVTYHYIEQTGHNTAVEHVGVIAQDLQKISPNMVTEVEMELKDESVGKYLNVDPSAFTYMLINAVQELKKENELLKKKLDEQVEFRESEMKLMEARLFKLEQQLLKDGKE